MKIIKVMRRKKRANSPKRLKLPYKLPVEVTGPMFPYGSFGYVTGFGYSSPKEYSEAFSKSPYRVPRNKFQDMVIRAVL